MIVIYSDNEEDDAAFEAKKKKAFTAVLNAFVQKQR
jgi:hypothetical protein